MAYIAVTAAVVAPSRRSLGLDYCLTLTSSTVPCTSSLGRLEYAKYATIIHDDVINDGLAAIKSLNDKLITANGSNAAIDAKPNAYDAEYDVIKLTVIASTIIAVTSTSVIEEA